MDNFTAKREATIRELKSRGIKYVQPHEKDRPMSAATGYLVLSFMLFLITYHVPQLMKVWAILAAIGIAVGVVLLARKICKWVGQHPDL